MGSRRSSVHEKETGPDQKKQKPSAAVLPANAELGNQALLALLQVSQAHAKLTMSQPGDADEREADRIADAVLQSDRAAPAIGSSPPAHVQRMCAACEEEEQHIQAKADPTGARPERALAGEGLSGAGRALGSETRAFFEARMGADFSGVRVHSDGAANRAARQLGARAFTAGEHVFFAAGERSEERRVGVGCSARGE